MGETIFVPSMVTDSVTALDTASGKVEVKLGKLSFGEVMKVWKGG